MAAAVQAGAAFADTSSTSAPAAAPSMSEEMLRVWQLRDAIDPAPQSVSPFDASGESGVGEFDAPSRTWRLEPAADATSQPSTGVTTSTGQSLTPNLDRLLQRSYQPLVPSDAPNVTSTATRAPWGGTAFSKSGSATLDGRGSRNRQSPGRGGHSGSNHYGGNGYNGGYNCTHSHNNPCGVQCGHRHCNNPGHHDNHGGGSNGGGGSGGNCDPPTPTPEPATMLLFGGAAAAAAGIRKRRQRN